MHQEAPPKTQRELRFRGRDAADAKRKALNFWYTNQDRLGLNIRDFSKHLALLPDGRTIVFNGQK